MKKNIYIKLLSIALACIMLVMSMGAYSGEVLPYQKNNINNISYRIVDSSLSVISYFDLENKENTIELSIIDNSIIIVRHYLEGIHLNSVRTNIYQNGDVITQYSDHVDSSKNKITRNSISLTEFEEEFRIGTQSEYEYLGTIVYKTVYGTYLGNYDLSLKMHKKMLSSDTVCKKLNAGAGTAISMLVDGVASILAMLYFPQAAVAMTIVNGFLAIIGVGTISGLLQDAVVEDVEAFSTTYSIKAQNAVDGATKYYEGEEFSIKLENKAYSEEKYYEGYYPWNKNVVASWIYYDFAPCAFPGVDRYL